MCAIAGVHGRSDPPAVRRMMELLEHRGPDGSGLHDDARLTLGHRRLSIIDLATGDQPMQAPDSGSVVVFNGEIYNYRDLRLRLEFGRLARNSRHHEFLTESDTEVILHAFEEWGTRCVREFRGMFAFALAGPHGLFLARDPLGVKPLYYAVEDGSFWFASEIKALLRVASRVMEFPNGCTLALPPGRVPVRLRFRRHYRLPREPVLRSPPPERAAADVERLLRLAVERRLVADVQVVSFLSGGVDSSLVAALAGSMDPKLETFSCGMEGSEDERYARLAAEHVGAQHRHREYDEEEIIASLPQVIRHLESYDPALVRSAVPNYFVSAEAARRAKVVLSGEGADELFAGYDYLLSLPRNRVHRELVRITGELHNRNLQRTDRMTMANSQEGRVPYLDVDLVERALPLPVALKIPSGPGSRTKWILRQVARRWLPAAVVNRPKLKFSAGAGSSDVLARHAERVISDREFQREAARAPVRIRSKEELLFFRLFDEEVGAAGALGAVGMTEDYPPGSLSAAAT
jgi:asparagine synthase (glutamine-hydrolysing)